MLAANLAGPEYERHCVAIALVDPMTLTIVAATRHLFDLEPEFRQLEAQPEATAVIGGERRWAQTSLKLMLGGVAVEVAATISWLRPLTDERPTDRLLALHLEAPEIAARRRASDPDPEVEPVCFSHDEHLDFVMFDRGFANLDSSPDDPYHFYLRCHPGDLDAFAPLSDLVDDAAESARRFACYALGPSGSWEYWVGVARRTWRDGRPELLFEAAVAVPVFVVRERLTSAERFVLAAIALRIPTAQIAAEMFVNASTVRNHVVDISRKLGVAGRREIEAVYARR